MIDKILNNYKRNEVTIKMLQIKINQWEEILTKDTQEIDSIYSKPKQENLGVQKSYNSNPIESMMIRVESQKEKINQWIKEIESKKDKTIIIGYMGTPSPDFQHNSQLYIYNKKG